MRKWVSVVFLTLLLSIFIFSSSEITSDLLALIFTLACGIMILTFSVKGGGRFTNWKMLSLIPLSWFVADLVLFLCTYYFGLTTQATSIISFIYYLPNLFMLIPIIIFLFLGFLRLHRAKFFLDLVALLVIILGMASGVVFSKFDFSELTSISFWFVILNVVTDIMIVVAMLMMLSSVSFKAANKVLYLVAFSFMAFIYADFDYLYEFIVDEHKAINISTYLFYISFYLMTIAALITDDEQGPMAKGVVQTPENLMSNRIVLYVWVLPLVLFIRQHISVGHLLLISVAVIIHQYINFIIHRLYVSERTVAEKETMMIELESIVQARTKELRDSNEALYSKSITDSLTGLYNREFLIDYLEAAIAENRPTALLYMDLDRFKVINDYHGHHLGDKVLIEVAKRLSSIDLEMSIIARVGGDEFAVAIPAAKIMKLTANIRRLIEAVKEPITIDEFRFHLEISVGISRFPKDAQTVDELLRYSDVAMYYVKNQDFNDEFAMFSSSMISKIERRNHIELLLRNADYEQEFLIYYQPKFNISTDEIIGMEALVRWNHPTEGMIYPNEFIQIAEETGLILGLSDWIFYKAMKQTKAWNKAYDKELIVSLNVSPISFDSYDFIPGIQKMIAESGINPKYVEFEITEHIAMESTNKIKNVLKDLKEIGVHLSIDDFGTGYSSLGYMKQFDIDVLKIARELVMNIVYDYEERLIVQAIITMAQGMDDYIIAEGVETEEQLEMLKELGCDAVQGYLTGYPVDAQSFETLYLKPAFR